MIIKFIGMGLVVAASAALGVYFSGVDHYRVQELLEFKKALMIFASEVEYTAAPLTEAMTNIAERTGSPVNKIFENFAQLLSAEGGSAYQQWIAALEKHKSRTFLKAEDWDALAGFGKTLGYLDKEMQLNTIRFTIDYIDAKVAPLQADSEKNKRMYRNLGFLGGLLLAVVLL